MKIVAIVSLSLVAAVAHAHASCPGAVKAGVAKAYPGSKLVACKHEIEDGREQYDARAKRRDGVIVELDVSTTGDVLETEAPIALGDVPAAVTAAFATRYPKTKAARAVKDVLAAGDVFYELAFAAGKHKEKEAKFKDDGTFVEEE